MAELAAEAAGGNELKETITCPQCGMTSYSLNDVRERYCGNCHQFHDDFHPQREELVEQGSQRTSSFKVVI